MNRRSGYMYRKTTPAQARAIADAKAAGAAVRDLAAAYGVCVRTIYRAIEAAGQPALDVRVDGWHAEFVITDEGPVRVTPWCAVAAA